MKLKCKSQWPVAKKRKTPSSETAQKSRHHFFRQWVRQGSRRPALCFETPRLFVSKLFLSFGQLSVPFRFNSTRVLFTMNVIISGGGGFLGRALTMSLLRDGHKVFVLSRQKQVSVPAGVETIVWDAKTANGWGHLMNEMDVVVHLAGRSIGDFPWWGFLSLWYVCFTTEQDFCKEEILSRFAGSLWKCSSWCNLRGDQKAKNIDPSLWSRLLWLVLYQLRLR